MISGALKPQPPQMLGDRRKRPAVRPRKPRHRVVAELAPFVRRRIRRTRRRLRPTRLIHQHRGAAAPREPHVAPRRRIARQRMQLRPRPIRPSR